MTLSLTSLQNPQVKEAMKLQNRRKRDEQGLFLIEGYRELSRAVSAKITIQKVFTCPSLFLGENEEKLIAKIQSNGPVVCQRKEPTTTLFRCFQYVVDLD